MESNKKNNCKTKILKVLDETPMGLTILEISSKINFNRNTASKHLDVLETAGLVYKKEIGRAKLFFSKKRKYLRRSLVNSLMQALLYAMKKIFPFDEKLIKEIGWIILDKFQFPIGAPYLKEFKKYRGVSDPQTQLKLFKEFYNSFDFFQEDLDIFIIELNQKKVVYRISNSQYLTEDYLYFFYIMCGITEGMYLKNLNLKVACNVEDIHVSDDKEASYIDISLEIQ